jgi:hypothetical protein
MAKVGIWGIEGLPRIGAPARLETALLPGMAANHVWKAGPTQERPWQAARDEIGYLG